MDTLKGIFKKYEEVIAYLFWGVLTTFVSWGSYSIFVLIFVGVMQKVFIANVLSWITAVLFAFVTNKICVFHSNHWNFKVVSIELSKFISARLFTGVFEIFGVPLLVKIGLNQTIFGIDGMVAKILVSVLVVILNYFFSKLFIFKPSNKEDERNLS